MVMVVMEVIITFPTDPLSRIAMDKRMVARDIERQIMNDMGARHNYVMNMAHRSGVLRPQTESQPQSQPQINQQSEPTSSVQSESSKDELKLLIRQVIAEDSQQDH